MNIESTLPRRWCQCCGCPLDLIQQVFPRRTLLLVTCWTRGCLMAEFTLGVLEHRQIARRKFRRCRIHGPGVLRFRAGWSPKPKIELPRPRSVYNRISHLK